MDEEHGREDQWFRDNEKLLLDAARVAREKREKERAATEKDDEIARLKTAHFMKCPKCGHDMKEESLEGVSVDRCTRCEGIFFDAGELDQVLLKHEKDRKGFFRKLVKI